MILIFFDAVQEIPRALSSRKYFYENAHHFAASILGIARHEGTSYPEGKVDYLELYLLFFR